MLGFGPIGQFAVGESGASAPQQVDNLAPAWSLGAAINVYDLSSTGYVATVPAATDAVGVTAYRWTLGGSVLPGVTGTTYIRSGGSPGGTDELTVVALDAAGNVSQPLSKSVTLQAAPLIRKRVQVRLTLSTFDTAPAANLSALKAAFFDQASPDLFGSPSVRATGLSTDADGWIDLDVAPSSLPHGGIGWLLLTDSDGTVDKEHRAFSGPVVVVD